MDGPNGPGKPQKVQSMALAVGTAKGAGSTASTIPSLFFDLGGGNMLHGSLSEKSHLSQSKDENVGGTDCYVVTSELDVSKLPKPQAEYAARVVSQMSKMKTTFWIGKQDHLVRQTRTVVASSGMDIKVTDDVMAQILRAQKKPVTPEAIAQLRARVDEAIKAGRGMPKSGEFVSTQTHENIEVNKNFSAADFK